MTEGNVVYAKDFKCVRCRRVNQMAVTFVGLNDPDGTRYPMCRKHADEWRMDVLFAFSSIERVYERKKKK